MNPLLHRSGLTGRSRRGFTLVELLVGFSLSALVLLGTLTTFLLISKTGYRIQNYTHMEDKARVVLENFAQDARMCQSSGITLNSSSSVTLTVPDNYTANGNQVTYYFDPAHHTFCKHAGAAASSAPVVVLMDHVTTCLLTGYDLTGPPAKSTNDATPISGSAIKRIELVLTSVMTGSGNPSSTVATTVAASENVISATYLLRN